MGSQSVLLATFLVCTSTWLLLFLPTDAVSARQFQALMGNSQGSNCPCSDPKLCDPIKDTTRKEVFAFATDNDPDHFKQYDWSKLTTVVMFGWINLDLMCLAHSKGVRVASLASVDEETFLNPEHRKQWISDQLNTSKSNFLDGLNFDYESEVDQNNTAVRDAYTALVRETSETIKKELPYFQVSVDVAWMPNTDSRYYDYVGLAEGSDLLFVMAYDEQSQILGECVAGPNSNYRWALEGLSTYMKELRKEIPANKLVLGVPWYGYKYTCISLDEDKCYIEEVPFRGVNCSDAAGAQIQYADISAVAKEHVPMWNATSRTPFFTYFDTSTNTTIQYQYDDPLSLSMKYDLAADLDIRGVGMWHIDCIDYSDTQEGADMRKAMFGALPNRTDELASKVPRSDRQSDVVQMEDRAIINTDPSKPLRPYSGAPTCPCSDPKLCEPIKDMNKKEVFAFSNVNNETHWQRFDWSKLTTVVMFNYVNTSLMCLAHSHGVRAVVLGSILELIVITPDLRHLWVQEQAQIVRDNFLDGLNFDYEHTMYPSEHYYRDAFTELVRETVAGLRADNPYAQISICTVYMATSQVMAYDYVAIAEAADFLFMMDYDESGTLGNGPNAGYHMTQQGVESFLNLNISAEKLVLGLPWYGDVYQCVSLQGNTCVVDPQGKGFGQWCYNDIMEVLDTMPDRYHWNESSLTPYFNFTDAENISHLVEYDNPRSLGLKYQLAADMGLRGVGMFLIDCLDFSDTQWAQTLRKEMFDALPSKKNNRNLSAENSFQKSDSHQSAHFAPSPTLYQSSTSAKQSSSHIPHTISRKGIASEDIKEVIRHSQINPVIGREAQGSSMRLADHLSLDHSMWGNARQHKHQNKRQIEEILKFRNEKHV